MSTRLAGYSLNREILEGTHTRVYAGVTHADQQPVMVKLLKAEYPDLEEITRLRHEFKILDSLDHPNIIWPLALEPYQTGLALEGDLKAIVDHTRHLEQAEPGWSPFTAQLRQPALGYRGKQTIEWIKRYQNPE